MLSKNEWINSKENNKLSVSLSFDEYIQDRLNNLNERLRWLSKNIKNISTISIDNCKISISRLENITPKESKELSCSLYKLLPKIKLTDLLMDVARITGFHKEFIHAYTNKKPDTEDTILIMATLLGMGTNIGLNKMADATPGITYKQLSSVSQWRMYDDAMSRAQTVLVNYHNKLKLAKYWGEGNTSSSDGMRLQLGVSSLHADSNPHYGTRKGITIYRFTSDQFFSYYSKIINTNSRDATHVLDGLLNNDTDLNIEEHYTDTAGYTDQVFALIYLLGFRFAPRIRDLSDVKLFTLNKCDKFSNLDGILKGKINEKNIKDNYDEVLRLASSIKEGTVTSSLIISKLASYPRQNSLATALREMGKIEKTIFILDYISNEELRRKIQKGLNKGEEMNGLARAIFFGKQGEVRERTMQNQLQKASALNLIINAINIWNTLYLEKAINYKESIGEYINYNLKSSSWKDISVTSDFDNVKHLIQNTREDALFLSWANFGNNELAMKIYKWFDSIEIFDGDDTNEFLSSTVSYIEDNEENKEKVLNFLNKAAIDVLDINLEIKEDESRNFFMESLKKSARNKLETLPSVKKVDLKVLHKVYSEDWSEVGTIEKNIGIESNGTRKMFEIVGPIIDAIENGKVIIIDEIDARLHPLLVNHLVRLLIPTQRMHN